jgi:uncharacterized protein
MNDKYNAHIHVFTGNCAPKDFLQVGASMGDAGAKALKWAMLSRPGSWLVNKLAGPVKNRTVQFLKIGVMVSQQKVFTNNLENYDRVTKYSGMKFIGLTIDMDYMTDEKNKPTTDFNAQINAVIEIKKAMPDRFFPFYGIDPRNPETLNLSKLKPYILNKTFSGIKLYPAKGFFPFDERLDAVYQFAEANKVPIMTHCTRTGSFYLGDNIWNVVPNNPASLNPHHPMMDKINKRIAAYKSSTDKVMRENKRVCNLFSHPENYIPILDKYPQLKLCMAHLGGVSEILGTENTDTKAKDLYVKLFQLEQAQSSWYEQIRDVILKNYANTYSDISYSLSDAAAMHKVNRDLQNGSLPTHRILFGTDYFMTEQENDEMKVVEIAEQALGPFLQNMMEMNVQNYLYS